MPCFINQLFDIVWYFYMSDIETLCGLGLYGVIAQWGKKKGALGHSFVHICIKSTSVSKP